MFGIAKPRDSRMKQLAAEKRERMNRRDPLVDTSILQPWQEFPWKEIERIRDKAKTQPTDHPEPGAKTPEELSEDDDPD